jgi:hypothetical protein
MDHRPSDEDEKMGVTRGRPLVAAIVDIFGKVVQASDALQTWTDINSKSSHGDTALLLDLQVSARGFATV